MTRLLALRFALIADIALAFRVDWPWMLACCVIGAVLGWEDGCASHDMRSARR